MSADLGRDLSCVEDCTPDFVEVTGRLCLAQAVARRLSTDRGRLIDDENYGYNLARYLNDDFGPGDIPAIQAGARAECLKDERVRDAAVSIVVSAAGVMTATVLLTDGDGPFLLVLAITAVTTEILKVGI